MSIQIKLYLRFAGFKGSPDKLTQFLGIKPDVKHAKGERILPNMELKRKYNVWEIHSQKLPEEPFEKHLNSLIRRIKPKFLEFKTFAKKCKPRLNCVIKMYNKEKPSIYVSSKQIIFLSEMSADIDFDMYNF